VTAQRHGSVGIAQAKADWDERIARRTDAATGPGSVGAADLGPPSGLRATAGRGQVTLDWSPVTDAAGYLVHAADHEEGPFTPLDHYGNDVLAVPHPPYVDTTGEPGRLRWYAVAALPEVATTGSLSKAVAAAPEAAGAAGVTVRVDAGTIEGPLQRPWRAMIGSEHLSLLLSEDLVGGRPLGEELRAALRVMHEQIGVESVRAHGILCDDLRVYREIDGEPVHDFTGVDRVYDAVVEIGMRPVVELSFMPHDLAADPSKTVFDYGAIVSPPRDWDRWSDLVRALTAHLVERYGLDEVREWWSFEVWNEANLEVFWSGTPEDYLRLYDVTVAAVRSVDNQLVVGGPSSAAAEWVELLLNHVDDSGAPVDFVSTHTYGSPPLDVRPILARHDREGTGIWWTEWGPTPQHGHLVGDTVFAATFLLDGMHSSMGRVDALSHWVASDHFEELGRPPRLEHGGFGLLTVGNLRKPRWWAMELLERLGQSRLAVTLHGDGANSLVKAIATRDDSSCTGVLVWNSTLDQRGIAGNPLLARRVELAVEGLAPGRYVVRHWRVDETHSNVFAHWHAMGGAAVDWPSAEQWEALALADTLDELGEAVTLEVSAGRVEVAFDLPQPGISYLELTAE
jgi:xylan 1,4-beta-xylosidase